MDHIPRVKHRYHGCSSPLVPLLDIQPSYGNQPLGFLGFEEYPKTQGYCPRENQFQANFDIGKHSTLAFLQSWLFFGLLAEAFAGPPNQFHLNDFITRTEAGIARITTECLPRYVWYWQVMNRYDEAVVERAESVDQCLRLANKILNQLVKQSMLHFASSTDFWSTENAVLFSLVILGEYLCSARRTLRQKAPPDLKWEYPLLDKALEAAGWCTGEVASFRKDCNSACRYYLSTINRCTLKKDHSRCDALEGCRAHQIDYTKYSTRHTPDCSGPSDCGLLGPSTERIAARLSDGGYPVLCFNEVRAEVEVKKASGTQSYVAISHVWSDGLGNPKQNCLNRCQLLRIQKLVNALYEHKHWPVPFWMDTLCIPVWGEYDKLRNLAIIQMADTYKKADKVLVLDNSLQYYDGYLSEVELIMRIRYSPWMTRLWTLQEARLSNTLLFQFKNRVIWSQDLLDTAKAQRNLMAISKTLEQLGDDRLTETPNAMLLIRALVTSGPTEEMISLSKLPVQADPELEELRQIAIQNMEDYPEEHRLPEQWMPLLSNTKNQAPLGYVDEELCGDLHSEMACPVMLHCNSAVYGAKGHGYPHAVDHTFADNNIVSYSQVHYYSPSALLVDVCRGLRGRTTSRIEDETICLSIMLGTDVPLIQTIPPLPWRTKELLLLLDSRKLIRDLLSFQVISLRSWAQECHVRRMKVLLKQNCMGEDFHAI